MIVVRHVDMYLICVVAMVCARPYRTLSDMDYLHTSQPFQIPKQPFDQPQKTLESLEFLSYSLWSRNHLFLRRFLEDQDGFNTIIDFLRPRSSPNGALLSSPCLVVPIDIRLHHGADQQPHTIHDTWSQVFGAMASILLHHLCHIVPHIIHDQIIHHEPWVPERLMKMIQTGSEFERYGALMGLNGCFLSCTLRERTLMGPSGGREENLIGCLVYLLHQTTRQVGAATQPRHRATPSSYTPMSMSSLRSTSGVSAVVKKRREKEKSSLFTVLRWRLAIWRGVMDLLLCLFMDHDTDIHTMQRQCTSVLQTRADWWVFRQNGDLVDALFGVLKFLSDALPKAEEERFATVFSGPGVLAGSALQVRDLEPVVRSVVFMVHRLGLHDVELKAYIMKQVITKVRKCLFITLLCHYRFEVCVAMLLDAIRL